MFQPGRTATDRQTARVFLAGSAMLSFWCEVAGVDVAQVIRVAGVLAGGDEYRAASAWAGVTGIPSRPEV